MRTSRTLSQVLGPNSPPPQTQAPAQAPSSKRKYAAMHNPHIASYKLSADDVNRVIHSLALPDREIIAAREHSNDAASATHFGGVQAYAKLAGRDWTFYVKALEVSIGRASEVGDMAPSQVDLDLGPAKVISRLHAKIEYDLQDRYWKCSVVGRNGLKVDGRLFKDRKVARLSSGQVLEVGGVQMMFVLPDSPPEVQATFLPDALREELEAPLQEPVMPIIPLPVLATTTAPTMPGPMTGDVDYAVEDARELKPPFSYATLISQAILSSPDRTLTLAQIYSWISAHYSWYRFAKSGWQNSIRHNLSLNKAFVKVPRKAEEPGKGMKWTIQEEFVDEFLNKSKRPAAQGGSRGSSVKRRRKEEAPSQTPPPQQQHQQQQQHDQNHHNHQMHQEERMHVQAQAHDQAPDQQQLQQHPQQNQAQVMPEVQPVQHVQHVQAVVPTPDLPGTMQQQAPPEPQHIRTPLLPAAQLDTKTAERSHRIMSTPPSLPPSARQQQPLSSPAPFWKYMVSNMTTPTGTTHAHLLPSPGAAGRFSPSAALHASVEFANDLGRLTNLHGQTPLRPTSSERQSMSRQEGLPSPHVNGKGASHGHDETTNGVLQVLPTAATTSAAVNAATGIEQLFDLEGVDLRKGFPEISRWSEGREGEAALYSF